ncbi:polysaccharide polymerase [Acinetobacter baumannii]|uniref:polysaccharide polymerase n=1 Tax=Acinetobacter baumannii TaxID=470 RepID=UPI0032EC61AE
MIKISSTLYILASLLVLSGAFYSIDFLKVISLGVFGVCIFIFFVFALTGNKNNLILDKSGIICILFIFSFVLVLISAALNNAVDLFIGVLLFLLLVINFSIFNLNKACFDFFDKPVKLTFLIITLINFSFGFSIPFNGAFSNPNSLGGIYAMLSFLSTGILLDKAYNSKGKKIDYYLLLIILLSTFLTLVSNSRISFISSCLCLIVLFLYFMINSFNLKKGISIKISFFKKMLATLVVGISAILILWEEIEDIFVKKVMYKMDDGGGVTGGRNEVWDAIIDNSLMFGHGRFSPHLEYFDLAAHNTFLSIYDQFGWLSCSFFAITVVFVAFNVFNPKNIRSYGITPSFICFSFLFLSISESMINKTIFFCFLMIVNLNSFKKNSVL